MHARAIYNVLTQGRAIQKSGSNPQPPEKSHPVYRLQQNVWNIDWIKYCNASLSLWRRHAVKFVHCSNP